MIGQHTFTLLDYLLTELASPPSCVWSHTYSPLRKYVRALYMALSLSGLEKTWGSMATNKLQAIFTTLRSVSTQKGITAEDLKLSLKYISKVAAAPLLQSLTIMLQDQATDGLDVELLDFYIQAVPLVTPISTLLLDIIHLCCKHVSVKEEFKNIEDRKIYDPERYNKELPVLQKIVSNTEHILSLMKSLLLVIQPSANESTSVLLDCVVVCAPYAYSSTFFWSGVQMQQSATEVSKLAAAATGCTLGAFVSTHFNIIHGKLGPYIQDYACNISVIGFTWLVTQVQHPLFSSLADNCVNHAKALLMDHRPLYNILGSQLAVHLCYNVSAVELRFFSKSMAEAVESSMCVAREEVCALVLPMALQVFHILEPTPTATIWEITLEKWTETIRLTVDASCRRLYMKYYVILLKYMGICSVSHLKAIFDVLDGAALNVDSELTTSILLCLKVLVSTCYMRVSCHAPVIFRILSRLWYNEYPHTTAIEPEIRLVCMALQSCCSGVAVQELIDKAVPYKDLAGLSTILSTPQHTTATSDNSLYCCTVHTLSKTAWCSVCGVRKGN
ncbi:hypothetical protein Pelo_14955 [Pelomyxa schiedti]|nr:hypothetical protein Pelo_14955 [Pelomyxa schiedti]